MPIWPFNCKTYDLSQRVNAGICPPRPEHPCRVTYKPGQGLFKFGLNRRNPAPLSLETVVSGSIILNGSPKSSDCFRVVFRIRLQRVN